jgi:hypothetical protein
VAYSVRISLTNWSACTRGSGFELEERSMLASPESGTRGKQKERLNREALRSDTSKFIYPRQSGEWLDSFGQIGKISTSQSDNLCAGQMTYCRTSRGLLRGILSYQFFLKSSIKDTPLITQSYHVSSFLWPICSARDAFSRILPPTRRSDHRPN